MRNRLSSRWPSVFALSMVTLAPAVSQATDGYFTNGWGVRNKAMAGVGIARGLDSMAAAHNPAGMAKLGHRFDLNLGLFSPSRTYSVAGAPTGTGSFAPGEVKSGAEKFLIPSFGMAWPQRDGSTYGLTVFGNGGMNTEWPTSANGGYGVFGGGKAGVNLEQLFVSGSFSRPLTEKDTIGASVVFARQTFSAGGIQGFNPTSTTLSGNGDDVSTGVGFRIGTQHQLSPGVRLGLTYAPKTSMSRFDKYAGLFAQGGKFDIPENYGVGLAIEPDEKSLLEFDVKTIRYSGVPAVANGMANMPNGLGSEDGPGFGWRDMTVYKLGYQWSPNEVDTYRLGLSYGRQPIPGSEMMFNILAPGVQEWHYTAGLSKKVGRAEWSAALVYSPSKSISGPNPNDPSQTITLQMKQFEFEVGYSFKF